MNGKRADLQFAWSPPSGRVRATYRVDVLDYLPEGDRYVCRLVELIGIARTGSSGGVSDETLRGLLGKCVRVPREALNGITLHLKTATLDGSLRRPYFFSYQETGG